MHLIDQDSLNKLLENTAKPAVTIYMPVVMSSAPPHITENQIRYKNMIRKATEQLEKYDNGADIVKQLEAMHTNQHSEAAFWNELSPGMLLCASPAGVEMFRLPIDTVEYVSVDESYHLAPVIGLVGDQREFYVLSLAQHDPKLYRGDMYGLYESAVEFPADAGVALNIDEPNQKTENQRSASAPSTNTSWFNGRGGARNPQDQDRIRFFRIIDNIITDKIDGSTPLIIAGVDSDVAEFRSLATHPTILEGHMSGNYKDSHPDLMFKEAYGIAWKELVLPAHQAAVEEYHRLHGANPGKVAAGTEKIEAATEEGRVDKLLTTMSMETTDTVQDSIKSVPRITFPEPDESKSINMLAAKVHQMSGTVINLMPQEMPDGELVVARLRY